MAQQHVVTAAAAGTDRSTSDEAQSAAADVPTSEPIEPTTSTAPPAAIATGKGRDRWLSAGIALVMLAVYLRSLMPGIGYSGDAAKWQMLSVVGGVPHATGYPLYVALIQAFHHVVPFGSAAWRTNLFSAVCAVGVVVLIFRLLRILDVRWEVATAAALTFGVTKVFWTQSVIAEVYTLHLLFVMGILVCLTRWRTGAGNRWLLGGVALLALSFGNHVGTILVVPAVLWLVCSDWRRAITLRNALWAGLFALVGASQYLYLLFATSRGGYVEVQVHNLADIRDIVTGGPFKNDMFVFSVKEVIKDRIPMLWEFLREEFSVLLVPMAYGLVRGLRTANRARRDVAIGLALVGLTSAFYGLNYDVLDVIVFFLPLFLVLALFLGIGLDGIVGWIGERWAGNRPLLVGAVGALAAIPLASGLIDYTKASQRGTVEASERFERAMDVVGSNAILITDTYDDSEFFWYYVLGEGLGTSRNLRVVHEATPGDVKDYFAGRSSQVTDAAELIGIDHHPLIYTASPYQPAPMRRAGFKVTEVAKDVWRIDPPAAPDPDDPTDSG
jgi:hypothetical protein